MEYTTNQKGLITEMQVMLKFIQMGYNVSQPLNSDSKYDCILDVNGKLLKIQIKTAHMHPRSPNCIEIKCRSVVTSQNKYKQNYYNQNDIDYFATCWKDEVYLVPVGECSTTKSLHLTNENLQKGWSYLEDYKAQEVLNAL